MPPTRAFRLLLQNFAGCFDAAAVGKVDLVSHDARPEENVTDRPVNGIRNCVYVPLHRVGAARERVVHPVVVGYAKVFQAGPAGDGPGDLKDVSIPFLRWQFEHLFGSGPI